MALSVEFVGYDRDGDKVWRRSDNGRVLAADDEEEAWACFNAYSAAGFEPGDYAVRFGPITKEKI